MRTLRLLALGWALAALQFGADGVLAQGNAEAGAKAFRACAACHSLEPDRHMTGPSLADIWGRRAATVEGFTRYSPALKSAEIVWNEITLDAWLADPRAVVPGNRMTFRGIESQQARADLVAYLRRAGSEAARGNGSRQVRGLPDLKTVGLAQQVKAIRHCGDTYHVTTAAGKTVPLWEFNLRFKTDSSETGPVRGQPAIMPAGMRGDRASVIFADSAEISTFIEKKC